MSDLGIDPLQPGRYPGVVEKVEFRGRVNIKVIITYRFDTPGGTRRLEDEELISAPASSASHFRTTTGLTRVRDILRIKGLRLEDAELKTLPALLKGVALDVVTGNRRVAGFDTPIVIRVERP